MSGPHMELFNLRTGSCWRAVVSASIGAACIALSACGGSSSSPASPISSTPVQAPQKAFIDAYGDSTMWGFSATSPTTGAYTQYNAPYYLQRDLNGIYGAKVSVSDQGKGATTLEQLISGTDGIHPDWAKQMQNSAAKIVIVNHGLNDDVTGETLDQYRSLLIEFVSTARQYGKTPVLEEPNPSCDPARANLGDFVSVMDQVASDMGVPLVSQWAYIQTLPNWQSYFADCIHPNPAMYQIKAQREAVVLSPLVAKLL